MARRWARGVGRSVESLETLIRLLAAFMTASLAPTPQYVDPGAELRMPLLSQTAAPAGELTGASRWQQVDQPPSDLPGDLSQPADDPLDVPLDDDFVEDDLVDDGFEDEFIEDDLGDDLVEDDVASGQFDDELLLDDEDPLDAELDDGLFDDEFPDDLIDDPALADEPLDAPLADTFSGDTTATQAAPSSSIAVLPDGFGSGETFVSNPPAGAEAAQAPSDCDAVVESGRAVVGVGCGDSEGPWWLPLVGQTQPASSSGATTGSNDFPFNQSGPPPGFPFDDGGPFASDRGGVVIAAPARTTGRETVRVTERDGELIRLRGDGNVEPTNLVRAERIEGHSDRDNARVDAIKQQRAEIEANLPGARQAAQTSRPGLRTATQPANTRQSQSSRTTRQASANAKASARPGANLNPCQNAKRIAKNPKSAKNDRQLAKARANCRQFKKTQQQNAGQ